MWIVLWDPFLMKKLLKSEIYESVNSARCALFIGKVKHFGSKINKNSWNTKHVFGKRKGASQTHTKSTFHWHRPKPIVQPNEKVTTNEPLWINNITDVGQNFFQIKLCDLLFLVCYVIFVILGLGHLFPCF